MRTGGVCAAALLLLATLILQVSQAEDIYWEGEDVEENEFLEVKEEDPLSNLKRIKRDWGSWFSSITLLPPTTTTETSVNDEVATEDQDPDYDGGSGAPEVPERIEPDPSEKTLRVSFVVMEPFLVDYSNRDSEHFQTFSHGLAKAVNALFDDLPGTQKASLVRIQSRVADNFSCKVTLDIVTSVDNTEQIAELLRVHIRNTRTLGDYTLTDTDFSANVVNPGSPFDKTCESNELQCSDGRCVTGSAICDGREDCSDGADERDCYDPDRSSVINQVGEPRARCDNPVPCASSSVTICPEQRCDGTQDCPDGDDEDPRVCSPEPTTTPRERVEQPSYTTTPLPDYKTTPRAVLPDIYDEVEACLAQEFRCDETRCIPLEKLCDQNYDCWDGTDEANCKSKRCGRDDFVCSNGECIEGSRRCDRVFDCPNNEDEYDCKCASDEFSCNDRSICIEIRKRCDGERNCNDGSDEINCQTCAPDQWQCDHGNCIKRSKRCNGRIDCPSDRSDERNCLVFGYFKCQTGKVIPENMRCNRRYDCPPGDYSDEQNCPCGDDDFRCVNGHCIQAVKRCDRTRDCQDGSDELHCNYGTDCMAYEYKCTSGQCVHAESLCNGTVECDDGSDESKCPCKRGQFPCRDGSCINIALRCNGYSDCRQGEDERNCGACPADTFTCPPGSQTTCATRCDQLAECDNGEDELNCTNSECPYGECDGACIPSDKICNGYPDCSDGSDESYCDNCDRSDDFRCDDGQCIRISGRCNNVTECADNSDELHCNDIMTPTKDGCLEEQFRCKDGACVHNDFYCDGNRDCLDNSDEIGCPCEYDQFQCENSQCIPYSGRCNGPIDCSDGSDESPITCGTRQSPDDDNYATESYNPYPTPAPTATSTNVYDSGSRERRPTCEYDQFQCENSQCIPYSGRCNGPIDCSDGSDESPITCGTRQSPDDDNYATESYNPYPTPAPTATSTNNYDSGSRERRPSDNLNNGETSNDIDQLATTYGNDDRVYTTGRGSDYDKQPGYDFTTGYSPIRYQTTTQRPTYPESNGLSGSGSARGATVACQSYEWRCENGPCIDARRRCDGHIDCPLDFSDEFDCPPGTPVTLNVKTYPDQQSVRFGGDVVFTCRDEGLLRAPVRWVREGGRSIKPDSTDRGGRLEMFKVTLADSGVYICQAPKYLGSPGAEVRVTLTVEIPDRSPTRAPFVVCKPYEATCGNGECIPREAVCDRKVDCSDRSDEDMCPYNGECEPNQFQCDNRKCILKYWFCDSDDDCGDGSDEKDCPSVDPQATCRSNEFTCRSLNQCVPRSFHCDGNSDCIDGSDEVGCSTVYISKPPKPANVKLNPGETLVLTCEAVGIPVPIVSWRRNWGHVPAKCVLTNDHGVGTLTCPNMQSEDSGAYSCEAINRVATTFATPDAIVYVTQTNPCPSGYFNSEARSQSECIRCFCFGRATQCQSADLFTYNMLTPLGEGGTRLLGVALSGDGEVRFDPSILNHYYYESMRNGATVTKLEYHDSSWLGNFHPYLTLPESYNGNQLTSYGGHIKYTLDAHTYAGAGQSDNIPAIIVKHNTQYAHNVMPEDELPAVIVKGKYATLYHVPRNDFSSPRSVIEARFVPEYWQKSGPDGNFIPATREDIMMSLDAVERILLRADNNNAGVNITNFVMESAQSLNSGLGAASLVEECACPEGYDGLSCEKCKQGYVRENSGPWLGQCVRKACPAGTYGDPASGSACLPCPCPLTNKDNQFATTCSLSYDGSVTCDCFTGYEGKSCEKCAEGFEGNPLIAGDTCRVPRRDNCNPIGTRHQQLLNECVCKESVQGRFCDQCKNDSFYLSNDFRYGCARCFCSGESQQCMSSNLRRKSTAVSFNVPAIVEQVKVFNTQPQGGGNFRYTAPVETALRPTLTRGGGGMALSGLDRSKPTVYYWSMPASFAGNKVTAYGGFLRYTLDNVPSYVDSRLKNKAADVQLISDNHLTFQYFGNFQPSYEGVLNVSVQLLETGWQRSDGKEVPREYFLLALADVKTILIKATYSTDSIASPLYASIDTAESDGTGPAALHVEQCVCPPEHIGTSCEDCAPGYTRGASGLYLSHCEPCQCNDHSRNCHPETGQCYECLDNTDGPQCELCKEGYERDGYDNCIPIDTPSTTVPCRCDPRGESEPCNEDGTCTCKRNVDGENCDRCREGTFGLDASNPDGCTPCFCSGASNGCQEANHYYRAQIPAPIFGDRYGGYSIMDMNAQTVINDQFVPIPDKSELMYIFTFPADTDLYWSLPLFPGNRVLSYGGYLSLRQEFKSNNNNQVSEQGNDVILVGDGISVAWYNPNTLRSEEALSYQVPLRESEWTVLNSAVPATRFDFMRVLANLKRVLVKATLAENIVSTSIADVAMDTATDMREPNAIVARGVEMCNCAPGHLGTSCETCAAGYYKNEQDYCTLCPCSGHDCQLDARGELVCNCRPPHTGRDCSVRGDEWQPQVTTVRPPMPQSSMNVRIINRPLTIKEIGSTVNFTCQAQSQYTRRVQMSWSKVDGELPQDRTFVDEYTGVLLITNLQISDSGQYICQTTDGRSMGQASVTLKVPANQMVHPTVRIEPPVKEYFAGDRIELQCLAQGSPQPSISWQRASRRALPMSSEQYDEMFVIKSAREEDSGEYRCIAANTVGSSDSVAVITVRPRPSRPQRDRLVVQPTAPSVNVGQSARLVCTGSINVPTGSIDWVRKDGDRFEANVRSDNGVLYVEGATLKNAGVYVCQTHGAQVDPEPVLLTVVPLATMSPAEAPEVVVNVQTLSIPSGGSDKIDCHPRGTPAPLIRWSKHESEMGRGVSQRGNTLIFNEAEESDAGYYVCQGIDRVTGRVVHFVYLYVDIEKRQKPVVEVWPGGEQPVALGNTQFEFHCRVSGIPTPDVTWSRAGGRALSAHVEIKPNNILKFEKIEVNDEGEYICTGDNLAGSASASGVIKVRSPPVIVITPSNDLQVNLGEPVVLNCRAEGYPEPRVTIRGPEGNELVSASRVASLRIASAEERDDGAYTCLANNQAGTIEEAFVIRVEQRGDGGDDFGGSGDGDIEPTQAPRPRDPTKPLEQIVYVGQDIDIYCNVSYGYDPTWDRGDRRPLQGNARQYRNQLIIRNVAKNDSGVYVCSAINYETREVQVALYTNIKVLTQPQIVLRPPQKKVQPGESPTVECIVLGDQASTFDIIWRPTYKPFSSRVRVHNATLIFQQIQEEDAGKYECIARNQYVNASATAEVIVVEESDVTSDSRSHSHSQWVRPGASVVLSCNVSGAGVSVHWSKDGRRIPSTVRTYQDGSLFIKLAQPSHSGRYVCLISDGRGRHTSDYINLHIEGAPEEALVRIEQPRGPFRAGENVEVLCKSASRDVAVEWIKRDDQGNRQYVDSNTYGGGSMLKIISVGEQDAGIYQCIGRNRFGLNYTDNLNLEIVPGSELVPIPSRNIPVREFPAALRSAVDLPCYHDLEDPISVQWRREYAAIPIDAKPNQPILHINSVTEGDAGLYVCRVSNRRTSVEAKAILRVVGVIPRFDGESWVALPPLKDAYSQFDIEISFKPTDDTGLILYNSQNPGRSTDFIALQLEEGIPEFILDTGSGPVSVKGDRPLSLNAWHTIRISKLVSRVTMDVDNIGPFVVDIPDNWMLDPLGQPLYIGGVPDYDQLPADIAGATGFAGCVSMLILGQEERNIMMDRLDQYRVESCDTCAGNTCQNDAICQEARTERGYVCICELEFAGADCDRRGEACRPTLCGSGKCIDAVDGYKCACPLTHTGRNCEIPQQVEYPAFTGSAYVALKTPDTYRHLIVSMKVKATAPVTDGIIMYCAESARGYGGFTALLVRNGRLEFRYDVGEGRAAILTSNSSLPENVWTDVQVTRSGLTVSMNINLVHNYEQKLDSAKSLNLETLMFIGGVDDTIILNSNTGVNTGFKGCIKDLKTRGVSVDFVNDPSVESFNVQECSNTDPRGDIPEGDPCHCNNGGTCSADGSCYCPAGFSGATCETRVASSLRYALRPPAPADPCAGNLCRNGGTCRPNYSNMMNHTCDCPLGYAGASCQMRLDLGQSVGFNGNGYLELPSNLVRYDELDRSPAVIALRVSTVQDGLLAYQGEALAPPGTGDYLIIRIERGYVVVEWDMGSGSTTLSINSIDGKSGFVTDGDMHRIVVKLLSEGRIELSVDGVSELGFTNGFTNRMGADSNIYIGGMPERLNVNGYGSLIGCIDQVEFMDTGRGVNLGSTAVTGRNTQPCKF